MADDVQSPDTASETWRHVLRAPQLPDAERLLLFYATTLKNLDNNFDLTDCCYSVASFAADIAVGSLADWCRIDLREDLEAGPGVVVHKENKVFSLSEAEEELTKLTPEFYICVPIKQSEKTMGRLTLARDQKGLSFDSIDRMMAEEFANKLAVNLERALLYKNLAEMKNAAEAANRAKTNFIANVTHEIRTPLGAIVGFSDLLTQSHASPQERAEWAGKVRANSTYLLRIIDDILDISKVEAGKVELEISEVNLRDLLRELVVFAKSKISEKEVQFEIVLENELPLFIKSDATRLLQILSNLIGNAIKFTTQGFVRVTARRLHNPSSLSFEITDSGIGISASQAVLLFQPFTQADASHTRKFGGTGLGLALSRTLSRRLGGDLILLHSEPGKGSAFLVTVDCICPERGPFFRDLSDESDEDKIHILDVTALDFSDALQGREILLVEDSPDIQVLIKRFLEGAGAVIHLANNGEEGLQAARKKVFDVILMDVQMPIKDGCQTVSELRALGYPNLIVALTANTMKEERDRCLVAGFDAHLTKPIRRHELIQKLMGYLAKI